MIKCVSVSEHIVCVWFVCEHMYTFGHVSICAHSIYACVCGNVLSDVFMWLSVGGGACVFDLRCGVYVCVPVCKYGMCVAVCTCVHVCLLCTYAGASVFGVHVCAVYKQVWICLSVCTGIQVCLWV